MANWTLHNTSLNCSNGTLFRSAFGTYIITSTTGFNPSEPAFGADTAVNSVSGGHITSEITTFYWGAAEFDKEANGGNGDGRINANDAFFSSLRLWRDGNHNGISEPAELHRLQALGLAAVDLGYSESRRVDQHGNQFRYRAKVRDTQGAQLGRWAWDVFFVSQ